MRGSSPRRRPSRIHHGETLFSWTAPHSHGGTGLVTVLTGQISLKTGGTETTYGPGQQFVETPGNVHAARNAGTVPASIAVTFVVPPGVALTTVAPSPTPGAAPAPPSTGTGLGGEPADSRLPVLPFAIAAAAFALGAGYLRWGRRRAS
ncbi:MAG: cupin domain-containing protein [Tepidiformaceae bacterium]